MKLADWITNIAKVVKTNLHYQAYGGYQVQLTGKRKKTGGWYKNSLGSGCASITTGYESATKTLDALYKADSKGWVRSTVKHHNRNR